MTKNNFNDIDNLFREGLNPEEDLISFKESDWSKMNERLDRFQEKRKRILWITSLGPVAALFLLFMAVHALLPEQQKQMVQQMEVQNKVPENNEVKKQNQITQRDNDLLRDDEHNDFVSTVAQNRAQTQAILIPDSVKNSVNDRYDSIPENTTNMQPELNAQTVLSNEKINSDIDNIFTDELPSTEPDDLLMAEMGQPNVNLKPERRSPQLAVSLLVASDYNGVDNLNNGMVGGDFGLIITFEFTKNWSLSTGGIYAKKLYDADYNSYNPSNNIWSEYYPKSVSADCRVLDIPLNINYTFYNHTNTKISFGSGISSYIMLSEDYRFSYAKSYDNEPLDYHLANENKHWLSVLNLQVNYEKRLNPNISLSLQPFMKVPLANIGFAGVKLQSLGVAATLNWNFDI